jgi:hypothetical protein
MRTLLCLIIIILYVGLFNLYIYELTHPFISLQAKKLFYNYLTLGMIIFYVVDSKLGFDNWLHKQLNHISILSVIINFLLIILNWHLLLNDAVMMFWIFNSAVFLTTSMILISSIRHNAINE